MPPPICPPPAPAPWRRYPFVPPAADPRLVFPAAEGYQGDDSDTYYASGILRGETSGRLYAFLTIFAKSRDVLDILSADLHVLALFDLDTGAYDTGSRFDLPPNRQHNLDRINVSRGRLDVSYTSPRRVSRMRARTDAAGDLVPFAYDFELSAEAVSGTEMALDLCADALQPPQPVGGAAFGGRIAFFGQAETYSYFQLLAYTGRLRWGETEEAVSGRFGWLDRQWFPDYVGRHAGLLADRYGHQWSQLFLDNGWAFSLWRQFDRREEDREVMFTGLTACDPAGRTVFADDLAVDILSYVRDPGLIEPLLADVQDLAGRRSSNRYVFDAVRLRVPSLALDVVTTPLVAAPAHHMPVDYFSGPTRVTGTMAGTAVTGFGFHERTQLLSSPRQLVIVLRDSLLHLPDDAVAASPLTQPQLGDLAWAVMDPVEHWRYLSAVRYIEQTVRPALIPIAPTHRPQLEQIAQDLVSRLSPFA
jgi:Predicted secreted hydrolase